MKIGEVDVDIDLNNAYTYSRSDSEALDSLQVQTPTFRNHAKLEHGRRLPNVTLRLDIITFVNVIMFPKFAHHFTTITLCNKIWVMSCPWGFDCRTLFVGSKPPKRPFFPL